jgi:hydroxypyruvate reductase
MTELTARELLVMLYQSAIDAVDGRYLVNQWLTSHADTKPLFTHCVAIGKAASAMLEGTNDQLPGLKQSLVICPPGKLTREQLKDARITRVESSHPVPDERSLAAGQALINFLSTLTENDHVLFLISGGTSALVEMPLPSLTLDDLQAINRYLLSSGKDIHQMNAWRQQFSLIKGGGLLNYLRSPATLLLISDVKGDKPEFIGSGLLAPCDAKPDDDEYLTDLLHKHGQADSMTTNESRYQVDTYIVGNNAVAREAVYLAAQSEALNTVNHDEFLDGDVKQVAHKLYDYLRDAEPGVYIWGGEPTVILPENPGKGGRNQALALEFARLIVDTPGLHFMAAGTDGVDGNSNAAGAAVSMHTCKKAAAMGIDIEAELQKANSGMVLMATDDLIRTEKSNTNVMDIMVAYKTA